MSYLSVSNFWKYQNADVWKKSKTHPPWFKHYVHRDADLDKLHPCARLLFWELVACATRYSNVIERDLNWLYAETRVSPEEIAEHLPKLLQGGWLSETRSRRRSRKNRENVSTVSENHTDADGEEDIDLTEQNRSTTTPALTDITQPRPTSQVPGAQRILDQCDVIEANTVPAIEMYCEQLAQHPNIIMVVEEKLLCFDSRDARKSKTALAIRLLQDAVAKVYVRDVA